MNGKNFQPDAQVQFLLGSQTTPLTTNTVSVNGALSTTQLSATIPATLLTSTGTASISVLNVADATQSNALAFNIVQSAITSMSLTSAAAGTPGLTLIINGNNFISGLTVQWSINGTSTPLTPSQVNSTQITVAIPASLLATAGPDLRHQFRFHQLQFRRVHRGQSGDHPAPCAHLRPAESGDFPADRYRQ